LIIFPWGGQSFPRNKDFGTEKRTLGHKKGHWDGKKDTGTEKRTLGRKKGHWDVKKETGT
jgi:hypothetical protein